MFTAEETERSDWPAGWRRWCLAALLVWPLTADAQRPIEVGILPYMPTGTLIAGHQPLRLFFEQFFQRPVALSTAPDFLKFQKRVAAGDFDFIIIGPGPGWQLHLDAHYEVVAVSRQRVRVFILVARNSPWQSVRELRGKTLGTIDRLTVTTQITRQLLEAGGLDPDSDLATRYDRIPYNVVQSLALGEIDAAGFPNVAYLVLPEAMRTEFRKLAESAPIPGLLFMVRPAVDAPDSAAFGRALFAFAGTQAGQQYMNLFSPGGLQAPEEVDLGALDQFVPDVRALLQDAGAAR